jgi:hypothetical protein
MMVNKLKICGLSLAALLSSIGWATHFPPAHATTVTSHEQLEATSTLDSVSAFASSAPPLPAATNVRQSESAEISRNELPQWVRLYTDRYKLTDPYSKLVNDKGAGFDDLYGVRNFRMVLPGILYRGGANNLYHRDRSVRRKNENPLTDDGLQNLCEEGFGHVVYLYRTNFKSAQHHRRCQSILREDFEQEYLQYSPFSRTQTRKILELVYETIKGYQSGPVYLHCWNGWHASGLASALALRQFCGWSGEDAVRYWDKNTDGTAKSPSYEGHRRQIRNFKPESDLLISPETQALICPSPSMAQ